jgi:hypothetical protein
MLANDNDGDRDRSDDQHEDDDPDRPVMALPPEPEGCIESELMSRGSSSARPAAMPACPDTRRAPADRPVTQRASNPDARAHGPRSTARHLNTAAAGNCQPRQTVAWG